MFQILNGAFALAQLLLQLGLLVAQPDLGCAFLLDVALQLMDDRVPLADLLLGLFGLLLGGDLGALGGFQPRLLGPDKACNGGDEGNAQGDLS